MVLGGVSSALLLIFADFVKYLQFTNYHFRLKKSRNSEISILPCLSLACSD